MAHDRVTLKVIRKPKPGTRNMLLLKNGSQPVLTGPGNLIFGCGNPKCRAILVEGVYLSDVVIVCPQCGAYNETPSLPP